MWVLFTLVLLFNGGLSDLQTRFINIECEMLDPFYATYKVCKLQLKGRGIVALNIHAVLNKGPFNNAKVNLSLFRKFNGYRPFMFNQTHDFCKLMASPRNRLSFATIIIDMLASSSNLNHTCPYAHDIIVRDLIFDPDYFKYLPLPSGDYRIQIVAATDNDWKTTIKVYLQWVLK
ncbi:GH16549 [Drosophila grimshawi]|uniref:GH16549 n=1 Tax=Drosophila grimshawi TaxID=7222 RepID=B4J1L5_DROGR|nr:GH16549 [Drosophila grimshawi]